MTLLEKIAATKPQGAVHEQTVGHLVDKVRGKALNKARKVVAPKVDAVDKYKTAKSTVNKAKPSIERAKARSMPKGDAQGAYKAKKSAARAGNKAGLRKGRGQGLAAGVAIAGGAMLASKARKKDNA